MTEAPKRRLAEKAATVVAPALNTLAFIIIARELGADALGGVALLLSLAACVSLSFELSHPWRGSGGKAARAAIHLAFMAIGGAMSLVGSLGIGPAALLPFGLYVAYSGAASAALVLSRDEGVLSIAGMADGFGRLAMLFVVISNFSGAVETWVAGAFFAGGLAALSVSLARKSNVKFGAVREEFASASVAALAFSVMVGMMMWIDKPLLYILDSQIAVGNYFAVQRTVIFIGSAAVVITGMVSHRFSELGRSEGLRLVTLMERYASLCVVPMGAFYVAFSSPIVSTFFGASYASQNELVYPLVVSGIFTALASPSVSWLTDARRWRLLSVIAGLSLVILSAIPYMLLETGSLSNPSTAVAGGCVASSIVFYALARGLLWREGAVLHGHIPKHAACAALMALALYWTSTRFAAMGFVELSFLAMAGVLVYGLLLYLFGEFMQGEYGEFKALRGV
jgi:O-antigen/teichoic acid export membrane protein